MFNSFCSNLFLHNTLKYLSQTIWALLFAFIQKVCPDVFYKIDVLKHFRSSCPVCLRPATLLKMRLWHRCFPVNFVKVLRTPYFTEHLWWLLLTFRKIHWKYWCWSLFLIKMFSCKFCENFKNTWYAEYLQRTASIHYIYQLNKHGVSVSCFLSKCFLFF